MHNFDLAIASEGSFGPHPLLPFIPANEEILIFLDTKNQLEISASVLSTDTNYDSEMVRTEQELVDFASRVQFPSHKLIIRKSKEECQDTIKGISDWGQLLTAFRQQIVNYENVWVETDMRAMNNPTRLKVIEIAAKDLVNKINSRCPHCNMPGFGITKTIKGLPCSLCKTPTKSTLSQVYTCLHCAYTKEKKYPEEKTMEEPQYCDLCNP
jgi:regulator of sigma D